MFYYSNKLSIKVLVLSLLLLTPWMNIAAAPLTPEQALNRIKSSSSAKRVFGKTPYVLAYTEKFDNNDYLFVFNRNNDGFIIASADDRMPALLGYSDNGAFNDADAAPALKWWLSQYAEQAWEGLKSDNTSYNNSTSTRSGKSTVDPLLKTQWNQVSPFNLNCPQDANGQCVTGCVATAMAQVIKYYGHPSIGKGSYSYNWNETNLSFNYGSATFDYQNMLNEYNNEATDVEKAAVAQLMYACGVGVNMNYTSNESGASDAYVPYALTEYFDYDKSIQYLLRDYYSDSEWEEIIYNEVNSNRPVIYGGQAENGGHEFVCDGYDGEGKFHINWGWGGLGDGYFLLSALNPSDQGTGSYEGGYNSSQTAVCGIKPNAGSIQTTYPIYATGSLSLNERINNDIVKIGIINGGIYNYSPAEINAKLWLKAVSSTGKEYISNSGTDLNFPGCQGIHLSGFSAISLYLPSAKDGEKLEEGEYKLYLVYQNAQGTVLPVPIPNGCTDYIDMYVDKDGNISFIKADPDEQASIIVTELYPRTSVITGVETTFYISFKNNSNVHYSGKLYIKTFKKDSETALYNLSFSISLAAGLSQDGTFQMTYNNLSAGEYYLKCFDDKNEPCSDVFKITITNPIIEAEGITLDTTEKTMTEGDSFTLKATIDPETTSDKTVKWSSSDTKVATVEDGNVTAVAPGTAEITAETSNGRKATCSVTVIAKITTVSSITLSTTDWSGIEGDSFKLIANVAPENATNNTVTWTSSNDKVATVDAEGNVKAVGVGDAIITATANDGSGVKAEAIIHVVEPGPKFSYNDDGTATVIGIWGTETELIIPTVVTYNGNEYKITAIGDNAFSNISDITSVSIPESLSKIGSKAFNGCANLKEIRYLADDPVIADNDLFDEIVYLEAKLYVSPSTKDIIKDRIPWSKFTKTVGYLLGDANTDWDVDISDATTIANVAVGNEVEGFDAELADVNRNGEITISDALGAVRIILNQEVSASMSKIKGVDKEEAVTSGYLIVNNINVQNGTLDIAMNGTSRFVAVQTDVYLWEGMRLDDITTGAGASGHTVMYREVGKNVYRIVLFNFDGVEMDENGETLFTLHVSTEGDASETPILRNIVASDAKGIRYILGATQNQTTGAATLENDTVSVYVEGGVLKISGAEGELAAIYTTDGKLIGKYRVGSEVISLSPGIYIIAVGKNTIKTFVN